MLGDIRRITLWDKVAPEELQAAWGSGIFLFELLAGFWPGFGSFAYGRRVCALQHWLNHLGGS